MKTFATVKTSVKPTPTLMPEVIGGLTPPLASSGYKLATQTDTSLSFTRDYRPWFIWLLIVGLFPIGLLFLLYKETAAITVVFQPTDNGGTAVHVNGTGEKAVERAFEQMQV